MGRLLARWWMQRFVKAGSSPLREVMVVSLLYHKGRTARWFTAQRAFDIMCVALALTRGQTLMNLVAGPIGPRLREVAAAWCNSRGLRGGTSSGRKVWISSGPLERLNGALATTGPQKTKPKSCMFLRLKSMGKLTTLDKYLSVRQNQGLACSSDSNPWENWQLLTSI